MGTKEAFDCLGGFAKHTEIEFILTLLTWYVQLFFQCLIRYLMCENE